MKYAISLPERMDLFSNACFEKKTDKEEEKKTAWSHRNKATR
jgi:hypothetical protein